MNRSRPNLLPTALLLASLASLPTFGCSAGSTDSESEADASVSLPDASTSVPDAGASSCGARSATLGWVTVPAGTLQMGCRGGDAECADGEKPAHAVQVKAFALTETEITQAQYEEQTGEAPSKYDACADCPVDSVSFAKAQAFCQALGGRLPTEAEWEWAALGGSNSIYGYGDDESVLGDAAWYDANAQAEPHPVATKAANGYCAYDLLGNVWEWVEDCWHDTYDGAPADGTAWVEEDCTYRVLRGGAFGLGSTGLRVSNRSGDYPDLYFVPSAGFRCAKEVE